MSAPRNARAGVTWFCTHRAVQRFFLFNPDEEGIVQQLYWYITAVYAAKFGIQVHMVQLLSTHLHEVLTDTTGNLSRFFEHRNAVFARALKALRPWPEEVFRKAQSNWVELPTPDAVLKEMAYTAANCVAAGLVRTPQRWPGAKVLMNEVGRRVIRVRRPDFYFSAKNPLWPEEVELPIEMPKMLSDTYRSDDVAREMLQEVLDEALRKARADNKSEGRGYMRTKHVLKQSHTRRATSDEPTGRLIPTFCMAGDEEAKQLVLERNASFLSRYYQAWQAWQEGNRDIVFPYGTYKMRVVHRAKCGDPPDTRAA